MKFSISDRTKRKWRNRFIFVTVIALGIFVYWWYINSFDIYDFHHLTQTIDLGPARPFEPLEIENVRVPGMVLAAENEYLALYVNQYTTTIAVYDKRNGHTWFSSPPGTNQDQIANPFERNTMRSHVGFRFLDEGRRRQWRWLYQDAIYHEQFEIFSIPNGVRFTYEIGNLDIGIDAIPFFIERDYFYERFMYPAMERAAEGDTADRNNLRQFWFPSRDEEFEGFYQMTEGIRGARIHINNMLDIFYRAGWTIEDTLAANELSGVEVEISFDFFDMALEFALDGDRLIVNLPLTEFTTESPAQAYDMHFMQFFGAGGTDVDGFILVPSGSGGIINFNNGGHREDPFRSNTYGMDYMMNIIRPQVMQHTRLPVLGIQNDGAAILAHVVNGRALATINADASGRTNSYNRAWFSFTLRNSQTLNMDGIPGASGDLTVVQEEMYQGNITVMYHFLTGDNPGLGEMAQAYQQFLVDTGVLTPLDGPGDRTFYLDVVGGIGVTQHFLGTPYETTRVMTTIEDANMFVDLLNAEGINNIQMQLHGWFNRGTNHDVAKNIRVLNSVGRPRDIVDLNDRLQAAGGGLNPVVNFQRVMWGRRGVRNVNIAFEIAQDLSGMSGSMGGGSREALTIRGGMGWSDWSMLVHPGVLPFHLDDFLPAYERRLGIDSLALSDLGDFLVESFHRRNSVNRESSMHIVAEQMGRIQEQIPNLVVFGGNDYSLPFASHLVGVPTEADMFYIIDYEVPFYSMVVHGFVEFAGVPANQREHYDPLTHLLNSMTTGASPRYTFTAEPTRVAQFSPHERLYSSHYQTWLRPAVEHYRVFNSVFRNLRAERMVDFQVLYSDPLFVGTTSQVTVTEYSDGTRIYVNNTNRPFEADGVTIPARWFEVRGGQG